MLRKLHNLCLIGTIGLIGADRIDLFGGHGPFTLTPFLLLAPLVILSAGLPICLRGHASYAVPPSIRRQVPFLAIAGMFLAFTLASVPFGLDPERGLVLFADLLLVAVLGYCISVRLLIDPEREQLIVRSIAFGLLVYCLFCVGECIEWSKGIMLGQPQTDGVVGTMFAPAPFGPWMQRLSGTTVDANRAGFVLTMYWVLLDVFGAKSRQARFLRYAIVPLVLATLSISATACFLTYQLFSNRLWMQLRTRRAVACLTVLVLVSSLTYLICGAEIRGLAGAVEISDAIAARTSVDQGSSGESHILLIRRGLEVWLSSPKTIISGIGFGAAPKVVGDILGTTQKYANFHSLYATVLAEIGLPAFILIMSLFVYPIVTRAGSMPAVLAVMVFNTSYQSHMEALFWVVLPLLWSLAPRKVSHSQHLAYYRLPSAS